MSEHSIDHSEYLNWSTKAQQTSTLFVATVLLARVRDVGEHIQREVVGASIFLKHCIKEEFSNPYDGHLTQIW